METLATLAGLMLAMLLSFALGALLVSLSLRGLLQAMAPARRRPRAHHRPALIPRLRSAQGYR